MNTEKKVIDSEKLSKAVKDFLCGLIEKGKDVVEITEFNAELHKIIEKVSARISVDEDAIKAMAEGEGK